VKGVFYTLRAAGKTLENNGRIIVLGTIAKFGAPHVVAYSSSKAAVETMANVAAQELGSKGITVNTIHPGAIDTDMLGKPVNRPIHPSIHHRLS
jgi:3-oxoacyl-[acyl-carrier protein] reductase